LPSRRSPSVIKQLESILSSRASSRKLPPQSGRLTEGGCALCIWLQIRAEEFDDRWAVRSLAAGAFKGKT